jgi:hypothetical protein
LLSGTLLFAFYTLNLLSIFSVLFFSLASPIMSTQPPSHSPQQPALPNPSQRRKPRLHPHYYIKRATGEFVPLVPVDELPVDFYGLPRSMAYVDNARMAFLGVKDPRMGVYRVKLPRWVF